LHSTDYDVDLEFERKIVDIETAFLHGNLKETIYIEIPKGMEANENECLILMKTIYGLVQSAREFYKNMELYLLELTSTIASSSVMRRTSMMSSMGSKPTNLN
jgi:hypothetical protein